MLVFVCLALANWRIIRLSKYVRRTESVEKTGGVVRDPNTVHSRGGWRKWVKRKQGKQNWLTKKSLWVAMGCSSVSVLKNLDEIKRIID